MVIGIVTEAKDKMRVPIFNRIFRKAVKEEIKVKENPFNAIVMVLPYSQKALTKMTDRRLLRVVQKASRRLKKYTGRIVTSKYINRALTEKNVKFQTVCDDDKKRMFFRLVPDAVRKTAVLCKINLLDAAICISDTKMDRISEYLMRELCYDIKKLTICTKNTVSAKAFCENFFDETGFYVSVCERFVATCDIFIDVDESVIRIGRDLFVADFNLGYDFCGYDISHVEVAACIDTVDTSCLSCIYEYSKKG